MRWTKGAALGLFKTIWQRSERRISQCQLVHSSADSRHGALISKSLQASWMTKTSAFSVVLRALRRAEDSPLSAAWGCAG